MGSVLHRVGAAGSVRGREVASVHISQSRNHEAAATMCTDPERSIVTVQRELAFLADVRGLIRESVGADANIPTTAADTLLDELIVLRAQQS